MLPIRYQLHYSRPSAGRSIPPTLLTWMLYMAATLRAANGDQIGAGELFDQIATMVLPPRTNSPTAALAARRAAGAGDHLGAYAILREHIDELIAGDNANGERLGPVGTER
jgi:hypothetical protein